MPKVHNQQADAASEIAHHRAMLVDLNMRLILLDGALQDVQAETSPEDLAIAESVLRKALGDQDKIKADISRREERLIELLAKPKGGKGHVFTTRITYETRKALEEEAERTGRTIGDVAERWLERGQQTAGQEAVPLTFPELAPVMRALAVVSEGVVARLGLPSGSEGSRTAMLTAWMDVAYELMPKPVISAPERIAGIAEDAVCFLLEDFCRAAGLEYPFDRLAWPGDDPVMKYLHRTLLTELAKAGTNVVGRAHLDPPLVVQLVNEAPERPSPLLIKALGLFELHASMREMRRVLDQEASDARREGHQIRRDILRKLPSPEQDPKGDALEV